ncbi:MAG: hypothetical protein DWQ08_09175 [Proteobacteria bacterium]|nr:MAG: hypothetical protein DWQ08_09175 [Pseudomonadota bacterium]
MRLILYLFLLIAPYLLFWLSWWRYARHYLHSFRMPGISDMHQAWEFASTVSHGLVARRVAVFLLATYYVALIATLLTGN